MQMQYVLGDTDAEHLRLVRQARLLAPFTERLFRDAGIVAGMRVLDIGCGMGDVSMLAAQLVGPSGSVVGVDRESSVLEKARQRATLAGFENILFAQSDVAALADHHGRFDAVVGRFILMFLPDPISVLKALVTLLRPGGIVAFQEASWANQLAQTAHLPLRMAVSTLIRDTLAKGGARTNNELYLYRDFQAAGLPPPRLNNELLLANDPETRRWLHDVFRTLRPKASEYGLELEAVGELDTLSQRLDDELTAANSPAACLGLVGAHCRLQRVDR
jgi:2-polyprenyl-3-methyl-5-hydroxy-6-metoxy-1,4-benzoquinol methylase